jgi:hypothetical protein
MPSQSRHGRLVPAIHVSDATGRKTWMPGTRPGKTSFKSRRRRSWCARASDSNVKQHMGDTAPHSRGANRARVMQRTALEIRRGRRECRVLAATHGPRAYKKHGEGTTGSAESSGIPCAMVLTLIARSPWGPGFLAPITRSVRHASELGLSVGRPGPHAFASASAPFVRTNNRARRQSVHRIPRSTHRDDRPKRPS